MKISKFFPLLISFVFLAAQSFGFTGGKKKHKLEYNPGEDRKEEVVTKIHQDIKSELMGTEFKMTQDMEIGMLLEIVENKAEKVTSTVGYTYMTFETENPMLGNMNYDSRNVDTDDEFSSRMQEALDPMLNSEITFIQDRTGKVVEMSGGEAITSALNSSGSSFNAQSLLTMSSFPEKAVKIGKSWKQTVENESTPLEINTTYTLSEVKDGRVTIDFVSDVSKSKSYSGTTEIGEVEGTQNGSFIYEEGTMMMISGSLKQDITMTVSQNGQSVNVNVLSDMDFSSNAK